MHTSHADTETGRKHVHGSSPIPCCTHTSHFALQATTTTAHAHGATVEQALPLNTAYVCWHLARNKQLGSIVEMLSGVTGRPGLAAGFAATLSNLGKECRAGTLPDLLEVCCKLCCLVPVSVAVMFACTNVQTKRLEPREHGRSIYPRSPLHPLRGLSMLSLAADFGLRLCSGSY